jgi:hypothetical protein
MPHFKNGLANALPKTITIKEKNHGIENMSCFPKMLKCQKSELLRL